MNPTMHGTIAAGEALYALSRHKIFARPMSEAEIVEARIEEIRFISCDSDLLTKTQKDRIDEALGLLERAASALCPQEPPAVPPGLEDFQP